MTEMANLAETAVLNVGGKQYSGWTSVMVRRAYGASASEFEFTAAEPLDASTDFANWRIVPGDLCTITLAGILALTGYVFVRQGSFNSGQHGLMVTGRSLTADAVDSSAPVDGSQYKGYTFQALASALAQSVGVNLTINGSSRSLSLPFDQFSIAWGETVFAAVDRLARMRGLHLTDDGSGNWIADVFDPNGDPQGQLVEGKNLLEARASIDGSHAFNITNVSAQRPGTDHSNGDACRDNSATVTNPAVRAGRRRMLMLDEPGSAQDCVNAANYETAYNATNLVDAHCVVQGWQSAPGTLWRAGVNYAVKSPILNLDRTLTARQVTYRQSSEAGSRTEIDLCTPESLAFASVNISKTAQPGEPAYSQGTPARGATADAPDN
jgi:prophage tail gpP-like protein